MQLAIAKGHVLFALQSGSGQCFGGPASTRYNMYGKSTACDNEGLGGPWSNQVYKIEGKTLIETVIDRIELQI